MKFIIFLLLLIPFFGISRSVGTKVFKQDMAVHHTKKQGFKIIEEIFEEHSHAVAEHDGV